MKTLWGQTLTYNLSVKNCWVVPLIETEFSSLLYKKENVFIYFFFSMKLNFGFLWRSKEGK